MPPRSLDLTAKRHLPGDLTLLGEVHRRYKKTVSGVLGWLLDRPLDRSQATDAVFLAVFAGLPGPDGEGPFRLWLYRLAVREAQRRSRWWRRLATGRPPSMLPRARAQTPPGSAVSFVRGALALLKPKERVAVVLHDFEHLSPIQITHVTSWRRTTVHRHLETGQKKLQSVLGLVRNHGTLRGN